MTTPRVRYMRSKKKACLMTMELESNGGWGIGEVFAFRSRMTDMAGAVLQRWSCFLFGKSCSFEEIDGCGSCRGGVSWKTSNESLREGAIPKRKSWCSIMGWSCRCRWGLVWEARKGSFSIRRKQKEKKYWWKR